MCAGHSRCHFAWVSLVARSSFRAFGAWPGGSADLRLPSVTLPWTTSVSPESSKG